MGIDTRAMSDEDIQKLALERARRFRDEAPTTAAEAATIILDGVKAERWRILVGDDAHIIDELVRASRRNAPTTSTFSTTSPPRPAGASVLDSNRNGRSLNRNRGRHDRIARRGQQNWYFNQLFDEIM